MASGRVSKVKGKVLDIPNAPTIGTATAGAESVSIAFTANSSGKGGPTFSYIAKSNPGNITATGSTSPINVTGLTVGTSYTVSVAGVNPTGSSEYSSASNSAVPLELTSYESIATISVGSGGTSQIDFTSIPQTYTHLQLRYLWRSANPSEMAVAFNSGGTYYRHLLYGSGGGSAATASNTNVFGGYYEPTTNVFNGTIIDILDYKNTNKTKVARVLWGHDANGSGWLGLNSGFWSSTNAITSITLTNSGGANIGQYSHFALYGIKGV